MGAYSSGALICYFGREGGRFFGGGHLLERGRLFEEIRYVHNYDLYDFSLIFKFYENCSFSQFS